MESSVRSNTYPISIKAMEGEEGSGTTEDIILLAQIQSHDDDGLEEENQLQAVSVKGAGKKEADTVLNLESRLTSQRVADTSQFQKIVRATNLIKKDLKDSEPTSSSLVTGKVEQLFKYKNNATEAVDTIMATVWNLKQAIQVFKDKRHQPVLRRL